MGVDASICSYKMPLFSLVTVNSEINAMFLLLRIMRLDWNHKNKNSHYESIYM